MLRTAFISLLLFSASNFLAQTIISGQVQDKSGEPIVGANVFLANTFDGTSTDIDGHFRFETSETGSGALQVSYISYQTLAKAVELGQDSIFVEITLQSAPSALKEVVITAGAFEAGDEKTTEVLNSIDIATTAGATADITGVMNTLPGTQRVGETGQLFVRGGAASETRTLWMGCMCKILSTARCKMYLQEVDFPLFCSRVRLLVQGVIPQSTGRLYPQLWF